MWAPRREVWKNKRNPFFMGLLLYEIARWYVFHLKNELDMHCAEKREHEPKSIYVRSKIISIFYRMKKKIVSAKKERLPRFTYSSWVHATIYFRFRVKVTTTRHDDTDAHTRVFFLYIFCSQVWTKIYISLLSRNVAREGRKEQSYFSASAQKKKKM